MIEKLRKRFVRIAMLSVTLVLFLVILMVNLAYFLSERAEVDRQLSSVGEMRLGGQPMEPPGEQPFDGGHKAEGGKKQRKEQEYQLRYFVIRYTASGEVLEMNLEHIATVTEDTAASYLQGASRESGLYNGFAYRVDGLPDGTLRATFLNCERELDACYRVLLLSLAVGLGSVVLVYLLILAFSRRAIDPYVKNAEKQKQFITDASHELKTPLTVMTTSLKLLEMDIGENKWVQKLEAQVTHMRKLVEELVALARLDEEAPPMNITVFPVGEAVAEVCESFRDSIEGAGRTLKLDIPEDMEYRGDAMSVCRLVSILMENAGKYTPEGGEVALSLQKTKKGICIRQENTCEAMEKEAVSKLFDRFYRGDKARTRGGFGIGLSIARSIAEAHGGSINACLLGENRIRFTAELTERKREG